MYPDDVHILGAQVAIWNVCFIAAIILGYPVLLFALRIRGRDSLPRLLVIRWLVTVYVSAIAAQFFAYVFDTYTLFSSKTLYGAILALPLTALVVSVPWRDLGYEEALDCWTPPMFIVLAISRVGCFLQGCCYGIRSEFFGITFPPHGTIYYEQLNLGLLEQHAAQTLPVVPTQAISAVALFVMAGWSFWRLKRGDRAIFPSSIAVYSLFRFLIEFARDDVTRNALGPFSTSQWIALVLLAVYGAWRLAGRRSVQLAT
jgi:prolipoprotein diacylglyceryltransferase